MLLDMEEAIRPAAGWIWVSRSAIRPAAGRTIEAVVLYAPQRDGQEKQLCYSPRSCYDASKTASKINIICNETPLQSV